MEYDGTHYLYRKNLFGDITAIYERDTCVAKYAYDAYGVCKVMNPDGTENTDDDFIGNVNPIRYRGYYYDVGTGFYYLQTRYYDPAVGRFINAVAIAGIGLVFSRIGKSGGYTIDHHYPNDHDPTHVHINGDDGKTKVDINGNPLPGCRPMTHGEKKAFEKLFEKIIEALTQFMK